MAKRKKASAKRGKRAGATSRARASSSTPRARKDPRELLRQEMQRSIVTEPLLSNVRRNRRASFDVIIALNEFYQGGITAALAAVQQRAAEWEVTFSSVKHFVFARLTGAQIIQLAEEARELGRKGRDQSVIYRIWEDSDVEVTLTKTLTTVKADAAQRAFHALGSQIVWAVMDSGIDRAHPHFASRDDSAVGPIDPLGRPAPLQHMDFTLASSGDEQSALQDELGHGTHVAGIIAGYWETANPRGELVVGTETRDEDTNNPIPSVASLHRISGVAPQARLVSLKVIADRDMPDTGNGGQRRGKGKVSWMLKAIDQIHEWNQHGKRVHIHGVNMSVGYDFDPRWFGCGQSPICTEVNRLVKSGVCVVVSAGNSGYHTIVASSGRVASTYNGISITDPGNAELAITVGATHRDMPHTYGVSYFSSRGPTGDGRLKPDLLAPGERVWSCATGVERDRFAGAGGNNTILYCEQSGTSMAAPHVSGAIAAFLSVRNEFIGQPERVKALVMQSTIDLGRERNFQGAGLLDVMKLLHAV